MLTKSPDRGIYAFGQINRFGILLSPQCGQHSLRSKRTLNAERHAHRVIDGIRNSRYRRRQRAFAALFGPEGSLRISMLLDDDRLHRPATPPMMGCEYPSSPGFISMPSFQTISSVSAWPMPIHTEPMIWPSTETGFNARPQSCAAHTLWTVTSPVSSSTLTSATCARYAEYAGDGPPPLCYKFRRAPRRARQ